MSRGVRFSTEMQTWIYQAHRVADISESQVILRMLQIAREDLAPFDDIALRRILREPWQVVEKIPAFVRRVQRRTQPRLRARISIRGTIAEKQALAELARKHRTTMSVILRQPLERTIAKEAT